MANELILIDLKLNGLQNPKIKELWDLAEKRHKSKFYRSISLKNKCIWIQIKPNKLKNFNIWFNWLRRAVSDGLITEDLPFRHIQTQEELLELFDELTVKLPNIENVLNKVVELNQEVQK